MILRDGTVVPSHLGVRDVSRGESTEVFSNWALRHGEVVEVVKPSDPRSLSKKYLEYVVSVQHRDAAGRSTTTRYPHCTVQSWFGGAADFCSWTLRGKGNDEDEAGLGLGSKVTIQCLHGETNSAVIVGGIRDPADDGSFDAADGHHFAWRFNGVSWVVADDGSLELSYGGPTNKDGSLRSDADQDSPGSSFLLAADGSASMGHGDQSVLVDWPNERVVVSGTNVLLGGTDAAQHLVMGDAYRGAQQQLDQDLQGQLTQCATGLGGAATAVDAAAAGVLALSALHLVPVAGPIMGSPVLAEVAVALVTASAALAEATSALSEAVASLAAFEAQSESFLSTKNTTD